MFSLTYPCTDEFVGIDNKPHKERMTRSHMQEKRRITYSILR